jgi:hypothetical protein
MQEQSTLGVDLDKLRGLIAEQVAYLVKLETAIMERRYDPSQPIISLLFGAPAAYGGWLLWQTDDWYWRCLAGVLWAFCLLIAWTGVSGFFTPPRTSKNDAALPVAGS